MKELSLVCPKNKFFIKDFFSKCDRICSFLQIKSHLYLLHSLTLILVGFLGLCFALGVGKITPCLNLFRIILEAWNLIRKYIQNLVSVSENILFSNRTHFLTKIWPLPKSNSMKAVLKDFLVLFSVFVR